MSVNNSFQKIITSLQSFWIEQGCVLLQPYDLEVGAGTFHPATVLRVLGPDQIWKAAYVQPCRRPTDGRYGENPNRLQHYYQFQVIIQPSPEDIQRELHNQFISFVKSRRGSKITNKNKDLFTGAFWSGEKSLELGLIDDYGEMKSVLKQRFGENVKIKEFAPKKKLFGFSNLFSGAIDIFISKIEERISFKKFGL